MPGELTSRLDKRDTHRLPRQLLKCLVSYLSPWKRSSEGAFDNLKPGLRLLFIMWVPHCSTPTPAPFHPNNTIFFHGIYSLPPFPQHTLMNQSVDACRYKSGWLTNWKHSRDLSAAMIWRATCHEALS